VSTLNITRGLPAAGKTTFAKKWVTRDPKKRARVNRDELRLMIYDHQFRPDLEEQITVAQRAAVLALLNAGYDVIADDTNLRPKYVREWRRWARGHGHDFWVHEFPIEVDEAIRRDALRERPVGEEVIRGMMKYLPGGNLAPVPDEEEPPAPVLVEYNPALPDAVIFDIDGTLALMGDRHPHDLTRVKFDHPNLPVVESLQLERERGNHIIFLSGREGTEQCRADTAIWLRYNVDRTPSEPLFMRAEGDYRRDSIIKRELFDKHVRGHFNVRRVYDDRNQVVQAWRSIGLTVFQVAEGAF
jgi:predicted kinase